MSEFEGMGVPRVEWDLEAKAVYLRLIEEWPEFVTQEERGGCIFDLNYYDDSDVLGVEMLTTPVGDQITSYGCSIPPSVWVLAGRAWEMARPLIDRQAPDGLTGTRGAFTIGRALV